MNALSFTNFRRFLLLVTSLIAVLFLFAALRFLPVTDDNVHTESGYIMSAVRWADGQSLYSDFRKPPYLITPFPPLWYGLLLLAQRAGITTLDGLTFFGRALSMAALLGVMLLAYIWNRKRNFGIELSLLSPAFYLAIPLLIPMAIIARQDLPALFFSFLAVFIVTLRPSLGLAALAAIAAALAFLTKHSSIAAPIVIVIWLVLLRRWKHAAAFCLFWGLAVLPVLVYFQISSDHSMMMNLSGAKFGPFGIRNMHDIVVNFMSSSGSQIMLAIFGFALLGVSQKAEDPRDLLLKIYFVVSLGLALFACGFANASANHFLESVLVWTLLIPVGMSKLEKSWQPETAQAAGVFALSAVLLLPTLDVQFWRTRHERPEDIRNLLTLVHGKRILTDVTYLGARSGNPGFLDPISLTFAERAKAWSSQPITQAVRDHNYELVILHWKVDDPRWSTVRYVRLPESMRTAINNNYALCFEAESYYFYGPRIPGNGSQAAACPTLP